MISKPKGEEEEGGWFKPVNAIYAFLGLALLLLGYKAVEYFVLGAGGLPGGLEPLTCTATEYRSVMVPLASGETTFFLYSGRDDMSDKMDDAAKNKWDIPHAKFHEFYAEYLCNKSAPQGEQCVGVALDIGAHLGTHGLVLAKMGFQVHAFEPFKPTADLLRCSALHNGYDMYVVQEGISNETGVHECLFFPLASQSQKAMFVPKGVGQCNGTDQSVPMVTIDHYWEAVLNKGPLKFIKIDVLGHEMLALQGAVKLLQSDAAPEYLLVNYKPTVLGMKSVTTDMFAKQLFSTKYRIYDCQQKVEVKADYRGDAVLEEYKSGIDMSTELLLVHPALFSGDLPDFGCGY